MMRCIRKDRFNPAKIGVMSPASPAVWKAILFY